MEFNDWWHEQNPFWGDVTEHIARRIYAVILAEREACAKICDAYEEQATFMAAKDIRESSNVAGEARP